VCGTFKNLNIFLNLFPTYHKLCRKILETWTFSTSWPYNDIMFFFIQISRISSSCLFNSELISETGNRCRPTRLAVLFEWGVGRSQDLSTEVGIIQHRKRWHTSMPLVWFEPTVPVFKLFIMRKSDRAARPGSKYEPEISLIRNRSGNHSTSTFDNVPLSIPILVAAQSKRRRSAAAWDHGFESRRGHGCLSLLFICCVVLCR
jgi:hypothetical protein